MEYRIFGGRSGKEGLTGIFRAAVAAAEPARLVAGVLRCEPDGMVCLAGSGGRAPRWAAGGSVFLVGGGKAGRGMAEAALAALGRRVTGGLVAVPPGCGGSVGSVRFLEAGHPIPDEGSRRAAVGMLDLLDRSGERDLVIAILSGGGSAMISLPPPDLSPADKERTCALLLRAGADIASFNAVRKHLSRVKGGWLARAARPARVFSLLLSDVPGDDPSVIASGPFAPDPSSYAEALEALSRSDVLAGTPRSVRDRLGAGASGLLPETPKPGDPAFEAVEIAIVGSNGTAIEGAAAAARGGELDTVRLLPGFLRGEARECAREFVREMRATARQLGPGRAALLVAGGETSVRATGRGRGGRSQEFALSAAIELAGADGMAVLCAGTDGIDGPTDAAGACADGTTCARAAARGLDPVARLADNDAYTFFRDLGDLVVTGPTGTNVADVALGLVTPARAT